MVGSGRLNWGRGSLESNLKEIAGPNITFKGHIHQNELIYLYQHCGAFVFFHDEDFGITPVEAMAAGRPVIALNRGGVTETVIPGKTGVLIETDSVNALARAVKDFQPGRFKPEIIKTHAQKFSVERFKEEFAKVFTDRLTEYQNSI
jgi:glycosyltransferase involved in cell wall biosynthesis